MVSTHVLERMINFIYGALIFLILIGLFFAVYQIFWAEKPTIAEQNFDSVFAEIKLLKKDTCFDVVIRPSNEAYTLHLLPFDNNEPQCTKKPCLCLRETGPWTCKVILDTNKDCSKGICVKESSDYTVEAGSAESVKICNKANILSLE